MKNKILILVCLLLLAAIAIGLLKRNGNSKTNLSSEQSAPYSHKLIIGSQTLYVDVADTPELMAQGLSDRASMGENQGMLFKFNSPQTPSFWMKDMNFALDFIWIKNGVVTGIVKDAPAAPKNSQGKFNNSNLPLYTPLSSIDEAIEVNAGWVKNQQIKIGDKVNIDDINDHKLNK